jgi:gas vesicle protein
MDAQQHDSSAHRQEHRDSGFLIGLLTGTVVGAGLTMWLAPQMASELRRRITDSARSLGQRASEQFEQASARVGETVGELSRTAQGIREDVAEVVAGGAHEVERFATAPKGDRH